MKKWISFTLTCLFFSLASAADSDLFLRDALKDAELRQKQITADRLITARKNSPAARLLMRAAPLDQNSCVQQCEAACGSNQGSGSAACWQQCTGEGYSSSSCANQCGVSTDAGSSACWNKCVSEGYSSSSCASTCGTTTPDGSGACWNKCVSEGYSSSSCAPRCGTSTSEGSQACWNKCQSEGYSSSSCAQTCGTN